MSAAHQLLNAESTLSTVVVTYPVSRRVLDACAVSVAASALEATSAMQLGITVALYQTDAMPTLA